SSELFVYQRIEAENIRPFIGKEVTFSFWVKANQDIASAIDIFTPTGLADVWLNNQNSTPDDLEEQESFTITNTWVRRTLTFTVPATAVKGLMVGFSTDSAAFSTSDTIYTTGWMISLGGIPGVFRRAGRTIG